MTSPSLVLSGFAVAGPGPSDVIDSVTATVNCWTADARTGPLSYELHDGKTGALIASATGTASTSAAHYDALVFPPPAWSQLYWLQLWIFASPGSAPSGTIAAVDYAALAVSYMPSGIPFAAPATGITAAAGTAPRAAAVAKSAVDITVHIGPTVTRSQVALAGPVQGNRATAGPVQGDGKAARPGVSRAQVRAAGTVTGRTQLRSAGNVAARAQVSQAGAVQGDGKAVRASQGDGKAARVLAARAQVSKTGVVRGDGTAVWPTQDIGTEAEVAASRAQVGAAGLVTSRAQVSHAAPVQGDGKQAGLVTGDGKQVAATNADREA